MTTADQIWWQYSCRLKDLFKQLQAAHAVTDPTPEFLRYRQDLEDEFDALGKAFREIDSQRAHLEPIETDDDILSEWL